MPSFEVRRALAFAPERLFDLAADVERYPEFLPGWIAARVLKREGNVYYTDQIVGFSVLRQRFRSRTVLLRPECIEVTSTDGPFRDFRLTWRFDPLPDDGCEVALRFELELRSWTLQELFLRFLRGTAGSILTAFEARAARLYGPAERRTGPAR